MSYIASRNIDRYKFDYYHKFNYNDRVLDALASCLHIRTPCAATFKHNNILYISYNEQIQPQDTELIEKQQEIIFAAIKDNLANDLLTLYLLCNIDFHHFIRNQSRFEENATFATKLKFLINQLKSKSNLQAKLKETDVQNILKIYEDEEIKEICVKTLDAYNDLLGYLHNEYGKLRDSKEEKDTQIKEQLLRPLQGVSKILYKVHNDRYRIDSIKILSNRAKLHAEQNIMLHFLGINKGYIGVSKLCCVLCDKYLEFHGYKHRGSHGMHDDETLVYSDIIFDRIQFIHNDFEEIEGGSAPLQYRKLSIDNFERRFPELCQLKTDLGLNRYCSSALSDFFDSLGSSINYCCSKFVNMISGQYTEISEQSLSEQPLIGSSEA